MFVDSHCHLNFPDLAARLPSLLEAMAVNRVSHALCAGVDLPSFPEVRSLAEQHTNIFASVGLHPDYEVEAEPGLERLVDLTAHPKVIAIGETGLDYFRLTGDLEWQRTRFRTHIRAARAARRPLIVHTRNAAEDTLRIMREEGADQVGGVMHCFTENMAVAEQAMKMNFRISFSGIVTFKKALELKEVAKRVPLDCMLIETDSPYLAPMPYRGKTNEPAYVRHVAEEIASLRGIDVEQVGAATTANFFDLFTAAQPWR